MEGLRTLGYLTRRESEIMDVLYKLGKATVADVLDRLPEKRSYSTVRAQLRVLEEKQQVRHEKQELKYVYAPIVPREVARHAALRHVLDIFFNGSTENLIAALMAESSE